MSNCFVAYIWKFWNVLFTVHIYSPHNADNFQICGFDRSILVVEIWSDWAVSKRIWSPAKFANIFELHPDRIHFWMMQLWWPAHILEATFPHFSDDDEKPTRSSFVKAWDAVSCLMLSLVRGLWWWCKLYFSDSKSIFLRSCKVYFLIWGTNTLFGL